MAAPVLLTQSEDVFTFDTYKNNETPLREYLPPHDPKDRDTLTALLRDFYQIDELIQTLRKENYKRITLQFPDNLVCDSSYVVQMIQAELDSLDDDQVDTELESLTIQEPLKNQHGLCGKCENCDCDKVSKKPAVWVLADTSYSSCCVDEVAAEHVGADVVVHFGDACLSPVLRLPSIHVLGRPYLDLSKASEAFRQKYPNLDEKVVLMADSSYTHCLKDLAQTLSEYTNLRVSDVYTDIPLVRVIGHEFSKTEQDHIFGNRIIHRVSGDDLGEYKVFHVTYPLASRLLSLSVAFQEINVLNLDFSLLDGPFPRLMRRYHHMHQTRTAGTIGILVNTLSLENTKKTAETVVRWVREAGKKCYMFVVGKPNVAKLANFEAIDVWCVLGCSQGGIIVDELNEYYKPIVTPYELKLALEREVTWTGKWVADFNEVLQMAQEEDQEGVKEDQEDLDDYEPEFSAVTGKLVSNSRPLRQIRHLQIEMTEDTQEEGQLVKKLSLAVVLKGDVSTSAMALQNREWTGLGSDWGDVGDEGAEVEEGRSGVSRGYSVATSEKR